MPARILHTAEIMLPMGGTPPIPKGGVIMDEAGTILKVGRADELGGGYDLRHDHAILLPGFINGHVHLTDASRPEPVPGGHGLNHWVRNLLAARSATGDSSEAVLNQLDQMRAMGTVAVGEVANNFATLEPIARSGMRCRFIHELIGFRSDRAEAIMAQAEDVAMETAWPAGVSPAVGAHAPYSVSPELMRLIMERSLRRGVFFYQHLAEDPAERLLYENASGPWRDFLEEIGAWDDRWRPQGCSPIELYDRMGVLNDRFVAVHLADARPDEIALLARRGVRAILSPGSNLHITGLLPPLEEIVKSGMRFGFGTDGRGSNPDVDVVAEARTLLERWPDLAPGIFLEALTGAAAEILRFDDLGALRTGTAPGLVAVEGADVTDEMGALERAVILHGQRRRVA